MIYNVIFALISLFAGVIGRICGLGGGVIIKPVMDATGIYPVAQITFMSACTVLAMTAWSVGKSVVKHDVPADLRVSLPLALGSAAGGVFGKWLFNAVGVQIGNPNTVALAQSCVLALMLAVSLALTLAGDRIRKKNIHTPLPCVLIGAALGILSAFIGGGSGPINMTVLSLLFSMSVKTAAINSLFIIMSAQITAIFQTAITGNVPSVDIVTLLLMALCAVLGAELGRQINRRIPDRAVNKLFAALIIVLICVNIYNIICCL